MPRKGARKRVGKSGRGPGRPPGSGGGSAQGAISGLNAYRAKLVSQRDDIERRISAIDGALSAMGSALTGPGLGRGRRGPRKGSLKEYIGKVLATSGGVMAVRDITAGVMKLGYPTRNKTLAKSVGIALTEMADVKKVGRGQFGLK